MSKTIKVLLIDNHVLFREGLGGLLRNEPDIDCVFEASNVQQALAKVQLWQPDLILMEIESPFEDELMVIRTMAEKAPKCVMVLLTNHDSDELLVAALRSGIKGYISKDSSIDQVLASIRGLQRGEAALSRTMTRRALDLLCGDDSETSADNGRMDELTFRELEVLEIIATGASNRAIANRLSISENTVKIHVHKILKKLNVNNRREAARCAHRNGSQYTQIDRGLERIFKGNWTLNQ